MIDPEMIEEYLRWKREKEYYPPLWKPQDWIDELIMSEARDRLGLIKDLFENETVKPTLDSIKHLVYADYKEIMEGN